MNPTQNGLSKSANLHINLQIDQAVCESKPDVGSSRNTNSLNFATNSTLIDNLLGLKQKRILMFIMLLVYWKQKYSDAVAGTDSGYLKYVENCNDPRKVEV
ncbi:unnamed protein product [Debaryomyces tyrocola]|nr:unnamed protein product [Debaryomyces tyrocola]